MLTKIIQAYRTAWHYPRAIGNSKTSIAIDRFLFIGIPLLVSITSFLSAQRYMDTLSALIIAFVIHLIVTTMTVATTRTEVEMVDIYLRKQNKAPVLPSTHNTYSLDPHTQVAYEFIKTTGSPDTPILSEDGMWIGFGHTLPEEFVNKVIQSSESEITKELFEELVDSVRPGYAVTYTLKDSDDLYMRECPRDTPKAFPVTILPPTVELSINTTTLTLIPKNMERHFVDPNKA